MSGKATRVTAKEILSHVKFREARRTLVDTLVALFTESRPAARLMSNAATMLLRALIVTHYAAFDETDRRTWGTPSILRQHLAERGFASPRHTDNLIARFVRLGYVEPLVSPIDRRTRILQPTGTLLALDREHLAAHHRFLDDLYPGRGYGWTAAPSEGMHLAIRSASFDARPFGRALSRSPMSEFLMRDAGYPALLLAAQAELSSAPASLSLSGIADRLHVSRTHVSNLFAEAEEHGLVSMRSRAGPQLTPRLRTAYDEFIADVSSEQDEIAQRAFGTAKRQSG